MAFYVFDLDGTLADLTHRRHHVEGEVKDWRAFFAACVDDAPIEHTLDLLYTLHSAGQRVEVCMPIRLTPTDTSCSVCSFRADAR